MIHFGTKSVTLGNSWKNVKHEVIHGYYLVCNDKHGNEHRYWFAENVNLGAFDDACNKYLGEFNGWQYWVDYCFGYDVHGNLAWNNLDMAEKFQN